MMQVTKSLFDFFPLVPLLTVFAWFWLIQKRHRIGKRPPMAEKVARPPGESCRLKILELEDDLSECAFLVVAPPIFLCAVLLLISNQNWVVGIILTVVMLPVVGYGARKARKLLVELRSYRLGFSGERVVGQELNKFIRDGFHVFHDLQFDTFNIDHVLAGADGVFCIETKTRSKTDEKGGHTVTYDGKSLSFPFGVESFGLDQAVRNAKHLQKYIRDAAGETVAVYPVLVLPGWFVKREVVGPVQVINQKELGQLRAAASKLSSDQVKRICHQLQQKSQMEF